MTAAAVRPVALPSARASSDLPLPSRDQAEEILRPLLGKLYWADAAVAPVLARDDVGFEVDRYVVAVNEVLDLALELLGVQR